MNVIEMSLTDEQHQALYAAARSGLEAFEPHPSGVRGAMSGSRRHYRERKHLLGAVRELEDAAGLAHCKA